MSTDTHNAFAQGLLNPGAPVPSGWVAHNGSDPLPRFNVYRNNVVVSLVQALRDSCPALVAEVGTETFDAWALRFVRTHPPEHPVLALYGHGLYGHSFAQALTPHLRPEQRWLADLARLDMARIQAFHAADAAPSDGTDLWPLTSEPERLAATRLHLLPGVAVVCSSGPVFDTWARHHGHAVPCRAPQAQSVLIAREAWDVAVIAIDHGSALWIQGLLQGLPLGHALAYAQEQDADVDLAQALALLIRQGCLSHITPPQ